MTARGWNLVWHDAMSVDIEELDDDHKRFVDLLARLEKAVARRQAERADVLVQELIHEAAGHFRREEAMLERYRFWGLAEHARGHAEALLLLENLADEIARRAFDQAWERIDEAKITFIEKLIADDTAYKWFFFCKGIKPEVPDSDPADPPPDEQGDVPCREDG